MDGLLPKSSTLKQLEQQIEQQVPAQVKEAFTAILVAGQKLMFDEKTHPHMVQYLEQAAQVKNPAVFLAHGIIKVLTIIHRESRGKMKAEAAFPAAAILLCYALEFLEKRIEATPELIAQSMQALAAGYFKVFGIDQAKIQQAIQQGMAKGQPAIPAPSAPTGGA